MEAGEQLLGRLQGGGTSVEDFAIIKVSHRVDDYSSAVAVVVSLSRRLANVVRTPDEESLSLS